jgi:hypothetical protein
MGHSVHPIAYRLGYFRGWRNSEFAGSVPLDTIFERIGFKRIFFQTPVSVSSTAFGALKVERGVVSIPYIWLSRLVARRASRTFERMRWSRSRGGRQSLRVGSGWIRSRSNYRFSSAQGPNRGRRRVNYFRLLGSRASFYRQIWKFRRLGGVFLRYPIRYPIQRNFFRKGVFKVRGLLSPSSPPRRSLSGGVSKSRGVGSRPSRLRKRKSRSRLKRFRRRRALRLHLFRLFRVPLRRFLRPKLSARLPVRRRSRSRLFRLALAKVGRVPTRWRFGVRRLRFFFRRRRLFRLFFRFLLRRRLTLGRRVSVAVFRVLAGKRFFGRVCCSRYGWRKRLFRIRWRRKWFRRLRRLWSRYRRDARYRRRFNRRWNRRRRLVRRRWYWRFSRRFVEFNKRPPRWRVGWWAWKRLRGAPLLPPIGDRQSFRPRRYWNWLLWKSVNSFNRLQALNLSAGRVLSRPVRWSLICSIRPFFHPTFFLRMVKNKFDRRGPGAMLGFFNGLTKQFVGRSSILGMSLVGVGRFTRAERARRYQFKRGAMPNSTVSACVVKFQLTSIMKYGVGTLSIWVYFRNGRQPH